MGINEVRAKSILQKSNLPDASYVINPYTGCVHGCVYCYARFMKRFTNHGEPWGAFLDAKVNAPEVLRRQLSGRREPITQTIFLSSVTDPYQSPEGKYKLTRGLLEVLLEYQAPVSILTKSDLVVRDIDIFKQLTRCSVGLSLSTLDDDLAARLEPRASSPSRRISALRELHESGMHTYAFISPYLPALSHIEDLVNAITGIADEMGVEAINPRGGNWLGVEQVLSRYYPDKLSDCRRYSKEEAYWQAFEPVVKQLADQHQIQLMGFYRH